MIARLSEFATAKFPPFPTMQLYQEEAVGQMAELCRHLETTYSITEFDSQMPAYVANECECVAYILNNYTTAFTVHWLIYCSDCLVLLPQVDPLLVARIASIYYVGIQIFRQRSRGEVAFVPSPPLNLAEYDLIDIGAAQTTNQKLSLAQCFNLNVSGLKMSSNTAIITEKAYIKLSRPLATSIALRLLDSFPSIKKVSIVEKEYNLESLSIKREMDFYIHKTIEYMASLRFPAPITAKAKILGAGQILCPLAATLAIAGLKVSEPVVQCPEFIRNLLIKALRAVEPVKTQILVSKVARQLEEPITGMETVCHAPIPRTYRIALSLAEVLLNECCRQHIVEPIFTRCLYSFGLVSIQVCSRWVMILDQEFSIAQAAHDKISQILYQGGIEVTEEHNRGPIVPKEAGDIRIEPMGYQPENQQWQLIEFEFQRALDI